MRDKGIWKILAVLIVLVMVGSCITPCIAVDNHSTNNISNRSDINETMNTSFLDNNTLHLMHSNLSLSSNPPEERWHKTFGGSDGDDGPLLQTHDYFTLTFEQDKTFTKCNYHKAWFEDGPNNDEPWPDQREAFSSGNTAHVSLSATPDHAGVARSKVGVEFDWDEGSYSWEEVKDWPVEVTLDFSYHIDADWAAEKGSANAGVKIVSFAEPWYDFIGFESGQSGSRDGTVSETYTTTVERLGGRIAMETYCQAHSVADGTSTHHSTAEVIVDSIAITFLNKPPKASFNYSPEEPMVGEEVTFDASSAFDPDGEIVKYEWNFGDDDVAIGEVVTHVYELPDDYVVTLIVTDGDGLKSSTSKVIEVSGVSEPDLLVTDVSWYPSSPKEGDTVTFTVYIKNQDTRDAGSFHVKYYIDGSYYNSDYVSSLSAGSITFETFTWTATCGDHQMRAVADSNHEVSESNEDNNERIMTINVICEELKITDVCASDYSFDPYHNDKIPDDKDTITICFSINKEAYVNLFIYKKSIYDGTVKRFDKLSTGYHCYDWDVTNLDKGTYHVMIRAIVTDGSGHIIETAVDESLKIKILRRNYWDPSGGYVPVKDKPISFKLEEISRTAELIFRRVTVETMLIAVNCFLTRQGYSEIPFPVGYEIGEWLKNKIDWGDCTITKVKRDLIGWKTGVGYKKLETWYYKKVSYDYGPTCYKCYSCERYYPWWQLWQWRLSSGDTHQLELIKVRSQIDNPILLSVTDKFRYSPNEQVNITASILDNLTPLTGVTVTIEVQKPDGWIDSFSLYDDGLHGDIQPNDGVYANTYTNTSLEGIYNITVSTLGTTLSGMSFERERNISIVVAKPAAEFTDTYSDYGKDTDGDDLYDYLTVEVEVNITTAGNYGIEGGLYNDSGSLIIWSSNYTFLSAGIQTALLDFNGMDIHQHGINGPYKLRYLGLYDENGNRHDLRLNAYNTSMYSYTEFQAQPAEIKDVYSDYGADTNGDRLFDYLTVEVEVNVTIAGNYNIVGQLECNGNEIVSANNYSSLNVGIQRVLLNFDGIKLHQCGIDGPYNLTYLTLYDENGVVVDYRYNAYTTFPYSYTDFQRSSAEFTGNFSDYGTDLNNDGLYDYLTIEAGVNVTNAGDYSITGALYNNKGIYTVSPDNYTYLNPENKIIKLNFDGIAIYKHGIDGSYNLSFLTLYDENDILIDYQPYAYTTSTYNYTDFQKPPAEFNDNYSDYGMDTNGDGFYEYLTVEIDLNVTTAGNYSTHGRLYDNHGNETAWTHNYTFLNPRNQTVQLNFDGMMIYEHGVNGSYKLSDLSLCTENYTLIGYQFDAFTTSPYNYTDFQTKIINTR